MDTQPKKDYDPYEYKPDPARENPPFLAKTANKNLLSIIGVIIVLAAAMYFYYSQPPATQENSNQPLIGGQTDEGGCLVAAGYSWCEPKQKCLRIWEESCYETEETDLIQIFAAEHDKSVSETKVTIVKIQDNYAVGSISFGPEPGEGGAFLARLVDSNWTIDYEGNGSVDCDTVYDLGYPQAVLQGYCDPVTSLLSESEARVIAEQTCIKGGESLSPGYYNDNSKTWWFDANLNSVREGCNPACVVSEDTKTAEINWRCTGLIVPDDTQGTVSGRILLGPTCPVIQNPPDPACADKPYQTTIQIIDRNSPAGAPFKVIASDDQGLYNVSLPAGEYNFQPKGGEVMPRCETQDITVTAGADLNIDFSCDSGIR